MTHASFPCLAELPPLLRLAGVSADAIADDYAESGAHLRDSFAEMMAALRYLDSRHGGVGQYLRSLGVEPELDAAIRSRLLTPS